jgi:ADP-dependent NAD(P)H-hydrate dehydratase / NAD(P)H-hydrate epimerase
MLVTCAEMRTIEARAIEGGIPAESLMEQAGALIARTVRQFFPAPGVCLAVFGRGNNGGDALVAARHLAAAGWDVRLVAAFDECDWSPLPRAKFTAAAGCARGAAIAGTRGAPLVILDGLLGIGAKLPLREPLASLCREINALRRASNAHVFALDIPTGLDGDTGAVDPACIIADTTLTIGFAKTGLVADSATAFVGRIAVLPLRELTAPGAPAATVATAETLAGILPRRSFDTHKGDYGRVAVVAGSPGYLGAAALCAGACVRSGAGLVTLYATPEAARYLALITAPEVMVQPVASLAEVAEKKHDVFAIGPGLGQHHAAEILDLIAGVPQPLIADADALNALAANIGILANAPGERILTPHPGEMQRLDPGAAQRSRLDTALAFSARFPRATLLLKGARTLVARAGEPPSYNTTGTPGMAVGGMGDTLTGIIAALVAQHVGSFDAARLGAWLCGRAAERAIFDGGETEETLTPTRLLDHLRGAFRELRSGGA